MEEKTLYDDCFYLEQKSFGTWQSYDKEGKKLITSLTEEKCIAATRFYLKLKQENQFEDKSAAENASKYSGSMDYKL